MKTKLTEALRLIDQPGHGIFGRNVNRLREIICELIDASDPPEIDESQPKLIVNEWNGGNAFIGIDVGIDDRTEIVTISGSSFHDGVYKIDEITHVNHSEQPEDSSDPPGVTNDKPEVEAHIWGADVTNYSSHPNIYIGPPVESHYGIGTTDERLKINRPLFEMLTSKGATREQPETLRYEVTEDWELCFTCCPYGIKAGGSIVRIGSGYCSMCNHHIINDDENKIVTCSYKKDHAEA